MKFRLSSEFGALEEVREGKPHNGIDINFPEGTELHSIVNGVVEKITDYGSENIGTGIIIKMEDGTRAIYGHLSEVAEGLKVGDKVEAGDFIALSGNTGHSTGPHLHFGLWKDGEYIDPTSLSDELIKAAGQPEEVPWYDIQTHVENAINNSLERFQESVGTKTEAWLNGFFEGVGSFLFDSIYSIALVGGGILIIAAVAGWKDGYKWTGLLFTANAVIKYLFGDLSA